MDAAKKYAKQLGRRGVTPNKLSEIAALRANLRTSTTDISTQKGATKGVRTKFADARGRIQELRSYLRDAAKAAFHKLPDALAEFRAPSRSHKEQAGAEPQNQPQPAQ